MSTLLLAVLLHLVAACTCHQVVTPIISGSGLYFDKMIDVKFTNDDWNIVTYLDIKKIQSHLDIVESLFVRISSYCENNSSSKVQIDCLNALSALRSQHENNIKKYSSVSYILSNQMVNNKRSKRGLINAGGSILKTLFGILDSDDAIKFSEAIDQVQSDENQLLHLMRDNIHVIKSTITTFNSSMSKLNENESRLNKNIELIDHAFQILSNSNDKLEIKSNINVYLNAVEGIIISLSFDIEDINNAILFSKMNILHPTVLSPYQLYSELEQNVNNMPRYYELPVSPLSLQNIHDLIDVSQLASYIHNYKIIVIIKIPLVLPQTYNLYHVIPMPIPYDITQPNTFALISPSRPYLAITVDHMFYSPLQDINKCKVISDKFYICKLDNVYSSVANPICESILITEIVHKIPSSCEIKLLKGSIELFHKINNNRWIYVLSEPGKCHVSCENDGRSFDETIFGTGILSLTKTCKAFYKMLQFVPSSNVFLNVSTRIVSNFNLVKDDCCEKNRVNSSFSHLPYLKLNNINNLDSLLQASTHLDSFEQELNKIENPNHFQKYGVHYMSLSYMFFIIFCLYLLYKARKFICPKPPCCVQIFNQCNNTKKVSRGYPQQSIELSEFEEPADPDLSLSRPTTLKRNILVTKQN
ncbi:uncharacterized protein LOC113495001 [Trichoplusia ni]|uniref:Uncharacterized protein LOC113495001 n=1 Tax=Trichoplusia ni TaxID=7111 RepID=A0A7E5VM47_TRINI|nr:uncharacterized protein LOC113495001 [Trichoplusia ni]